MVTMQRAFSIASAIILVCFVSVRADDHIQGVGLIRNAGQWPDHVVAYSHSSGVDVWVTRTGVVVDEYTEADGIRSGNAVEEYFVGASVVDVPSPAGSTTVSFFKNGSHTPIVTSASRTDVIPFRFQSGAVVNVSVAPDGRVMRSLQPGDESLAASVSFIRKGDFGVQRPMDATKAQSFVYGSFIGGAQFDAIANMEVMPNGNILVAGTTKEFAFPPSLGGYAKTIKADHDAFVLICDAKIQTIKAMSFLGGSGTDRTRSLARDDQNNIYLAIETNSTDMPATPSAQSKTLKGGYDAFVARFDSTLTKLLAGFYHGGNRDDSPRSIAVDQTGLIYLAGGTMSTSGMPNNMTPSANLTWTYQEGMNTKTTTVVISAGNTNMGQMDGFVSIYSPSGSMQKSRYYGQTGNDIITNVAVDSRGYIVVTGSTTSTTFETIPAAHPTWSGRLPYRKAFSGGTTDAFIAKMSSGLNFSQSDGVTFATLFGGNKEEEPVSLWIDDAGKIFVAGNTTSTNLPTSGSVYPTALGKQDGFVFQIADNGTSLLNGTYIGGNGDDVIRSVRPSQRTSAFLVCGATASMDFPIEGVGTMSERFGPTDGFFTMMNFGALTLSSLLSGLQADTVVDYMLDFRGDAFIAANTTSGNLRTHDSAYATKPGGVSDGYLTKFSPGILEIVTPKGGEIYCVGSSKPLSWDASGIADTTKFRIEYSVEGSGKWSDVVKSIGGRSYLWKIPASVAAGTYRIRISTVNGHVSELTTPFTIDIPPTISKQPASATVCEGAKLTIAVTASSVAAKYQWKKDGVVVPGATSSTYTVDNATTAMAGRYECVITGDCPPAVTSQPATVTISAKPAITTQPLSQSIDQGKALTLTVAASGTGLTYQWMKDNVKIDQATSSTYSVAAVAKNDEGTYSCDVTGTCGTTSSVLAVVRVNDGTSVSNDEQQGSPIRLVGPQPASDIVVFTGTTSNNADERLTIIDILGSVVKVVDFHSAPGREGSHVVDVHDLPPGVYVAKYSSAATRTDIPFTVRR